MPHIRKRQFDELFARLVAFSPLIGVFGHRQVGKSTFVAEAVKRYWTLDDRETRKRVSADPKAFLNSCRAFPIAIDECQLEPELFPALKERVRVNKRPGQFILTGSVRFTSRKAVKESLAGRLASLEMFPLLVSELMRSPLPDALPGLLGQKAFSESSLELIKGKTETIATSKALDKYLANGGLPGLCFIREDRLRAEGLSSLHSLILDRDLRLIVETKLSMETLRRFLGMIASNGWNPLNLSDVKRRIGLAHQTQKQLLFALESIFLIRRIPLTPRSGEIVLLEDQFEEKVLSEGRHSRTDQLLSAFFRNVRGQFHYRLGDLTRFESYWTRSGARVPLVMRNETGTLGAIVIDGDRPTLSQVRSSDSFLRFESSAKVLFLSDQLIEPRVLDSRTLLAPLAGVV